MSDERLDALAEIARNRGLKLVRSRIRTSGKRRFGKVGLTDRSGKAVFGLDAKGPLAKPEDVEDYLRNLGAKGWGSSLDVAAPGRKRRTKKPPPAPANDVPAARPTLPPQPKVREAKPADAPQLVALIRSLAREVDVNSAVDEKWARKSLAALKKAGEVPLVATLGKQVVGLIGRHTMVSVHRTAAIGRIPVLVVAKDAQSQGIGRMLVETVEQWCRKKGCEQIEVTSNDQLSTAHAFYRHMGYERTSIRFLKKL